MYCNVFPCGPPVLMIGVFSVSPSSHGDAVGTRRKLYSAVPGRHFVVVCSYTAQAEGEINLYKNDRVKGETGNHFAKSISSPSRKNAISRDGVRVIIRYRLFRNKNVPCFKLGDIALRNISLVIRAFIFSSLNNLNSSASLKI